MKPYATNCIFLHVNTHNVYCETLTDTPQQQAPGNSESPNHFSMDFNRLEPPK